MGTFTYFIAVIAIAVYYYISTVKQKVQKLNIKWAKAFFNKKPSKPGELDAITSQYYFYIVVDMLVSTAIAFPISWSVLRFARKIHSRMFFSLVHASPTKFLQRTSNGIILNRFSNDINILDNGIVGSFKSVISGCMTFLVFFGR